MAGRNQAFFITAGDLAARGRENVPRELKSSENLVYSSPATLAFNSPGAQGFGVKRAGLAVPGSVMLLVAPRCCGRNTSALGTGGALADRFYYLILDETDIVTGRHLRKIPDAVKEVCSSRPVRPDAVMICITCVDALLGTDMERVCRASSEFSGVPVVPCYMYALTREGRVPPMVSVRKSVYSLLKPRRKDPASVNLLGYFSPLAKDCELHELLRQAGVRHIREISRCRDFAEYEAMSEANFNLVLNPEARYAALDLEKRLGMPFIELTRMYQLDKVRNQYALLAKAAGLRFDDAPFCEAAEKAVSGFRDRFGSLSFSVGEWFNGNPFETALALVRYGFRVPEIFGTPGDASFPYIRRLAQLSPETKIYSNLSPTMLAYDGRSAGAGFALGQDAMYYHPELPGLRWNGEDQPFGYAGIRGLFRGMTEALASRDEGRAVR